jgi:hypothetical protein
VVAEMMEKEEKEKLLEVEEVKALAMKSCLSYRP